MGGILRKLAIWICVPIYSTIPKLYQIFYSLANARFFNDDTIQRLSSNIYVLISIVMLFAFSATLLSTIVNPDLLEDKKKGISAILKRSIIGLSLIVLIPFAFDEAYNIQANIMDKSLIEKVLVGIKYDTSSENPSFAGGNGGQVIAGSLISSVLYPADTTVEAQALNENLGRDYETMVASDISAISDVADDINASGSNDGYALKFEGLLAIIAGLATDYILLLFAMDTAVRMFKLAFYELTAPISVVAYIAAGEASLKRWAGELFKTYLDVFLRITAMAFYLFLISNLDTFVNGITGSTDVYNVDWGLLLKIIVIVGLLIFVKQIPDLINAAFGTKIKLQGGVGGRLGQMAAVGDTAKKAWDTVRKGVTNAATTVATLPALGAGLAARKVWNKGIGGGTPLKDTSFGKILRTVGVGAKTAGAYLTAGTPIKGLTAATKVYEGSEIGKQRQVEKEQNRASDRFKKFLDSISVGGAVTDEGTNIKDSIKARENIKNAISNSDLSGKQKDNLINLLEAKSTQSAIKVINDSKKAITDTIDNLAASTTNEALRMKLNDFKTAFNTGQITRTQFKNQLDNMVKSGEIGKGSANNMAFNLDKITNTLENNRYKTDSNGNKVLTEIGKLTDDNIEKLELNKIGKVSSDQDRLVSHYQSLYDSVKDSSSSSAKELMDNFVSFSERVDNKVSIDQSSPKYKKDGKTENNKYGGEKGNMRYEFTVTLDDSPTTNTNNNRNNTGSSSGGLSSGSTGSTSGGLGTRSDKEQNELNRQSGSSGFRLKDE